MRIKRQLGGVGIMIWAGIVGDTLIGPCLIPEGTKINSENYISLLKNNLVPFIENNKENKYVFMHDNAPAHASKKTKNFLDQMVLKNTSLMVWPPFSPDLNPIENLWSLLKRRVYTGNTQFLNKIDLWNKIKHESSKISAEDIKRFTNSMDKRLAEILLNKGGYIKK